MEVKSIFVYGDPVLASKSIAALKKKWPLYSVVEYDLDEELNDKIRMEASTVGFAEGKILLLKSIPNQKAVRSFVIDLCQNVIDNVLIVVWDSNNAIKRDEKTREINKTWSEFVTEFENVKDAKVYNVGFDFTDKESYEMSAFIQSRFKLLNVEIGTDSALALGQIVGGNRAMLCSEIEKLAISCPLKITYDWIINNSFAIMQEPVLWKFANAIDKTSLPQAYLTATEYIGQGVNGNVLAEILAKKARWQLAACAIWQSGKSWPEVEKELLKMGKFPSEIWHGGKSLSEKKAFETEVKEIDKTMVYLKRQLGLTEEYYSRLMEEDAKIKGGDVLPLPFFATQIVQHLQEKIVRPNSSKHTQSVLKDLVLKRSIKTYNQVLESLKQIRYGEPVEQEVFLMLAALLNYSL